MVTYFLDSDLSGAGEFAEATVTLALRVTVPAGTFTYVRARFPAVAGDTPLARIYNASNTLLFSGSFDTTAADNWNNATISGGLHVAAGTYKICKVVTRYIAKSGFFSGGAVVRGVISADAGLFTSGDAAPSNTSAAAYIVDANFVPDGAAIVGNLGIPSETDSGLTVARKKIFVLGLGSTADSALAYGRRKQRLTGQPAEADSGLTFTRRKVRTLGIASEADAAMPLARAHMRTAGVPGETDTGLAVGKSKRRTLGIPSDVESPLTITPRKIRTLGIPSETDSAINLGHGRGALLGIPTETDSAHSASRRKRKTLGIPQDTSSALPLFFDAHLPARAPTHTVSINQQKFEVELDLQSFTVRYPRRVVEVELE